MFILEDETLVAFHLEELVSGLGGRIAGMAMHIPEAMRLSRDLATDIAILDINVAGDLSYPIADLLMARQVPVIFITGYEHVEPGYQHIPLVQKPVTRDSLANALTAALASKVGVLSAWPDSGYGD